MDANEGAIDPDRLRRFGQLDRLHERVACGRHVRPRGSLPMPKGEKADALHKMKYRRTVKDSAGSAIL